MKITEVRNPNFEYEGKADQIAVNLKSYDSASYTKLAQKVLQIAEYADKIAALKEEVKQETRDKIQDLFDAEDEIKTRVVNTLSFIFTLSKKPKATDTFKYAEIVKELEAHLTPDLLEVLAELKDKYKSVTQKEAGLKVKAQVKEGVLETIKTMLSSFYDKIVKWAKKFDTDLDDLKAEYQILKSAKN